MTYKYKGNQTQATLFVTLSSAFECPIYVRKEVLRLSGSVFVNVVES